MEIFVIRAEDPLDMEGSADVVDIFTDKAEAEKAVLLMTKAEEEIKRKTWKDRWRSFATYYYVDEYTVATSALEVFKSRYEGKVNIPEQ